MKIVGNVIVYLGLFFIYMATLGNSGGGFSWPGLLLGGVVAMVGVAVTAAGAKRRQEREDQRAGEILRLGDLKGYALYLRPFDTDGKFGIDRDSGNLFHWEQYDRPGNDSLERMVAEAFSASALLIGAGGKGNAELGAATTGFLEDWKATLSKAIATASWIVIIPSAQPGTLWELGEILRQRKLGKTVFIVPPLVPPIRYTGAVPIPQLWSAAAEACARDYGLKLPAYDPSGGLFKFDQANLEVTREAPFDMRSPGALTDAFNSVL